MSTANAKNASAIESWAAQETTPQAPARRPTPRSYEDQGNLLAQIPDLDPTSTPKVPEKRADRRIIGQVLSIKLVLGAGLVLVILSCLPFIFSRASRPNAAVSELPAWSSTTGSAVAGNTAQTLAPVWPTSTAPAMTSMPPQTTPNSGPAILSPQPARVGDTRPTALTEPSWPQQRSPVAQWPAVTPLPAQNYDPRPPMTNTNPPDSRVDYRGYDRAPQTGAPDPRNLQADSRNDAVARFPSSDSRYDYRGNPTDAAPARRDIPAGGDSRDTRYGNVNGGYPPAAGPGSALMPSGTPAPTSNYRDPQNSEPGVARFEGTISTPPVRTSYDRAGSSTN